MAEEVLSDRGFLLSAGRGWGGGGGLEGCGVAGGEGWGLRAVGCRVHCKGLAMGVLGWGWGESLG